jgi:hypothetical protein
LLEQDNLAILPLVLLPEKICIQKNFTKKLERAKTTEYPLRCQMELNRQGHQKMPFR